MSIARVGDVVEFDRRLSKRMGNRMATLRGVVEIIRENSVIVDLTIMPNYRKLDLEDKTVVNHKNYKILEHVY